MNLQDIKKKNERKRENLQNKQLADKATSTVASDWADSKMSTTCYFRQALLIFSADTGWTHTVDTYNGGLGSNATRAAIWATRAGCTFQVYRL